MVVNRIGEHVKASAAQSGVVPPLVALLHSVRGKCDFHVVCVRKGVYQVRLGRSPDAVVSFRYRPDHMDDGGLSKAWRKLRTALKRRAGREVTFELENLACADDAMWLAERVGAAINGWRIGSGRADFPAASLVAQMVDLPELMVKIAIREYVRDVS